MLLGTFNFVHGILPFLIKTQHREFKTQKKKNDTALGKTCQIYVYGGLRPSGSGAKRFFNLYLTLTPRT